MAIIKNFSKGILTKILIGLLAIAIFSYFGWIIKSGHLKKTFDYYFELGQKQRSEGKYEQAIENFIVALKMNPKCSDCCIYLSDIYYEQNKFNLVENFYKKAFSINPSLKYDNRLMLDISAKYVNIGVFYIQNEQYNEANRILNKALFYNSKCFECYMNLGSLYAHINNLEESLNNFEEALSIKPDDLNVKNALYEAYVSLGTEYLQKKNNTKAIEYLRAAIPYNPKDYYAYNNLSVAYLRAKEFDLAIKNCKKVIEINPNCAQAYQNLGIINFYQMKFDTAKYFFIKTISLDPNIAEVYEFLGNVYAQEKKYDFAIENYKKALHLNPDNEDVYVLEAASYFLEKKYDNASECLEKALLLNPNDELAKYLLNTIPLVKNDSNYLKNVDIQNIFR